jgi:hypothetical protein
MIGPDCPGCRKPMRLFVVEERSAEKSGHYECIDCGDNSAPDCADVPIAPASNADNDRGRLRRPLKF